MVDSKHFEDSYHQIAKRQSKSLRKSMRGIENLQEEEKTPMMPSKKIK